MRVHCFQQVDFEGVGCIKHWINKKGYELSYTRFYEEHTLPNVEDFDMLVVMGGPMGVYDSDKYPWLDEELRLVKEAIVKGKYVVGICLGSQLIASALGAKVYPGEFSEIGWLKISTPMESSALLLGADGCEVFHWHGDTFDLPQGATRLASSVLTPNQAFVYGDKVLGLQFHLEVTEQSVAGMVANGKSELKPSSYVQSAEDILDKRQYIVENNELMYAVLDRLLGAAD